MLIHSHLVMAQGKPVKLIFRYPPPVYMSYELYVFLISDYKRDHADIAIIYTY